MADRTLTVTLVGDADQLNRTFRGVNEEAGRLGGSLRRVGEIATGFLAANVIGSGLNALSGFISDSVTAAADLEQSIGGVESVFGESAEQILEWGRTADQAAGLSKNAFNELATPLGAMLKNAGFGMDEVADKTIDLTQRAADMAATFGGPVDQALGAITAALRGETDPIERYGVSLRAVDVQTRALADTGKKAASELTPLEMQQARLALLFEQTASAAGQFAREEETAAGQAERQRAAQENLAAELGEKLLPIQVKVTEAKLAMVQAISDHVIPALTRLSEWIGTNVIPVLRRLGERVAADFSKFREYYESEIRPAIDNIVRGVQWVADQFEAHWPRLQRVVQPILDQISNAISTWVEVIKGVIGVFLDVLQGDWQGAWDNLGRIVDAILEGVRESLDNILTFLAEFASLVFDAAKEIGDKIIDGIVDGIRAGAARVAEAIANLPGVSQAGDAIGAAGGLIGRIPGFDSGGIVPGPRGAPRLILAHGGETVLPTHRSGGGLGSVNVVVNALDARGAADAVMHVLTELERTGRISQVSVVGA